MDGLVLTSSLQQIVKFKNLLNVCSLAAKLMHPYVDGPNVPVISSVKLTRLRRLRVTALSELYETSDDVDVCSDRSSICSLSSGASSISTGGISGKWLRISDISH